MILLLDDGLNSEKQNDICLRLQKLGFYTRLVSFKGKVIIALEAKAGVKIKSICFEEWFGVREVVSEQFAPFYLSSSKFQSSKSLIKITNGQQNVTFGGSEIISIAGPCAIENEEDALQAALAIQKTGCKVYRAMIFKPRTSPYSFQGLGRSGLEIIKTIKENTDLIMLTEVRNPLELEIAADHVDVFQVGTRNMSNYELLKHLGRANRPVLLKRGMGATVQELLCAAEYLLSQGNSEVILCERGIRTFEDYSRFSLDIAAVAAIKELSHLPVIVDPSHAAGRSHMIESLALASIGAGADGIMLEVHKEPDKASSDSAQAITPQRFYNIIKQGRGLAKALNRQLV